MGKRLTHQEFLKRIQKIHGDKFRILTNYQDSRIKVQVECRKCNNIWWTRPRTLLSGSNCPKCSIRERKKPEYRNTKKTDVEFKREVQAMWGEEYVFLDNYVTSVVKLRCRHNKCGTVWKVTPTSFLHNKSGGCPKCSGKKSDEEFRQQVENLVGDEYVFLDPYVTSTTKIRCQHRRCGHIWLIRPSDFINNNRRCTNVNCIPRKTRKTQEQIVKEVEQATNGRLSLIGKYQGAQAKTEFRCNECGYDWETRPNDVLQGKSGCPKCAHRIPWNTEKFKHFVYEATGLEYEVLTEYQTMLDPIVIRHNTCRHAFRTTPNTFKKGHRCPRCWSSTSEKLIEKWLKDRGISYVPQKIFVGCRDKRSLPFDFYIPRYNLAIEYDGEQHYRSVEYFGGDVKFQKQRQHDAIKDRYCKDHGINLLRIPYTVTGNDIGEIIQRKLNELEGKPVKPVKHIEQLSLNIAIP